MQQLAELDINSMALAKTYGGQGTSSGAGESSPLNALLTSAVSSEGRREGEHEVIVTETEPWSSTCFVHVALALGSRVPICTYVLKKRKNQARG